MRQRNRLRIGLLSMLGAFLGSGAGISQAALIDTYASYTAEYSDNVLLKSAAPVADLTHYVNVGVFYEQTGKQLEASILADVQYRHYANGSLEDDILPKVDATQTWFLNPGRFHWYIQDRLSQQDIDPLGAPIATNQETLNVFSTGPTFIARLSPVDSLEIDARYTNTFYSQTFSDSDRVSGAVRWLHTSSPTTTATTRLEAHNVTFIHPISEDYAVYEAAVDITTKQRLTTISVEGGGTVIDRVSSDDRSRPLGKFSLEFRPSPSTLFGLLLDAKYSDLTAEVLEMPLDQGVSTRSGNVYYGLGANAVYQQTWAPTTARFNLYARDHDYIDATPDEIAWGSTLDISHDFSRRLNGSVFGNYENKDIIGSPTITDMKAGLRTLHRLRSNLNVSTELRWVQRDSADPLLAYTEHAVFVSVVYGRRPEPGN